MLLMDLYLRLSINRPWQSYTLQLNVRVDLRCDDAFRCSATSLSAQYQGFVSVQHIFVLIRCFQSKVPDVGAYP